MPSHAMGRCPGSGKPAATNACLLGPRSCTGPPCRWVVGGNAAGWVGGGLVQKVISLWRSGQWMVKTHAPQQIVRSSTQAPL